MKLDIIYIEGNIGSGKSTILQGVAQSFCKTNYSHIIPIPEPIKLWTQSGALGWLYNKKIDSKAFQNMVLTTRATNIITSLGQIKPHPDSKVLLVIERGLEFGCQAFAHMSSLSLEEKELYNMNHKSLLEVIHLNLKFYDPKFTEKYFYIKVRTQECAQRITHRDRQEEKNIDLEYLKKVELAHNRMQSELMEQGYLVNIINGELRTQEICRTIENYL